jgi:DNA-binding beta-propeller fold protein YncE
LINNSQLELYLSSKYTFGCELACGHRQISTGAGPQEVFVSDDGHFVYVASQVDDFIHLVDTDKGYVVESVVAGTRPRRFAATSDGKELWVSSELSSEVHIIDREKFAIAGKIEFLPPDVRKAALKRFAAMVVRGDRFPRR